MYLRTRTVVTFCSRAVTVLVGIPAVTGVPVDESAFVLSLVPKGQLGHGLYPATR